MRCYNCHCFTLLDFCPSCLEELAELSLNHRILDNSFKVYSFYKYSEIKHLLYSKHKFYGYFVLNALAKLSFARFDEFFSPQVMINAVPLDDRVENGLYSHSALLARHLKSPFIKPLYRTLYAKSHLKYSGKSMNFRLKNKRNYELLKIPKYPVILVDDIITSGSSLMQAKQILEKNQISVLFALVLADAKD
ncbi:ComF family protein [Campylobacter sp. CCS1377]|uniref:ComF family protein n=1 Tax=Campylobacter sp. CCS1377 TaxID=3158229 RepID=A0AAU7E741_9BACT|nr:ComF family protein [Campylobacter jejuni]